MMQKQEQQHTQDYSDKWIYFGVAALAAFMGTLDSSIVNVALPTLSKEFNADVDVVSWVALSYILTMAALLLVGGKLLDVWGERRQFVIGFTLFTIGSGLCAFSVSIYMLIFSRAFQALGGAVLMSSNQGLIARGFPPHQRGRILGIVGTVVSVGLASGPVLGGFLIEHLGWRSIFWINLPIGAIAIMYSMRNLANNPSATKEYKFDWRGSIFMIVGLGAFFLG
ncbi:MAG TPA: MFS transporter, partial [candidate division Zixibacteria bacterium]|nr:MFS transporter [candidate division Zixibacteria bacterium]